MIVWDGDGNFGESSFSSSSSSYSDDSDKLRSVSQVVALRLVRVH